MNEEIENENENINNKKVVGEVNREPINEAISEIIRCLLKDLLNVEGFEKVMDNLGNTLINELSSPLFLGVDLSLNKEAKESLKANLLSYCIREKQSYVKSRNEDKRLEKSLFAIKQNLENLVDIALANISEEINRGAIIEGNVVDANCKNDKYNKIELNYTKYGCRVAVPTRGIFISTNCVQVIKDLVYKEVDNCK